MEVYVRMFGEIGQLITREKLPLTLTDGITLQEFFIEFDRRWGKDLPDTLWDRERKKLKGRSITMINNTHVNNPHTILNDGDEVAILSIMIGG